MTRALWRRFRVWWSVWNCYEPCTSCACVTVGCERRTCAKDLSREVECHRALWLFLETSNATLHCNYIGGAENWTATYTDVIGGGDDVVAHGQCPVDALLALREKVGHYWGVEGGADSPAGAPVPAVD